MLEIIFKNQHFCAVHKQAEWLSVPSRDGVKDPRPVVGKQLDEDLGMRIWPCHRLDEDVSGVLLFALSGPAHKVANGWFEQHQVVKTYEALSEDTGTLPPFKQVQEWQCKLMRGKRRAYEAAFGKDSHTKAWLKGRENYNGLKVCVWNLQPLTGRPHQLRYEMARHGWPIVGDALYGSKQTFLEPGIALQAVTLDFSQCPRREEFQLPEKLSVSGIHRFF